MNSKHICSRAIPFERCQLSVMLWVRSLTCSENDWLSFEFFDIRCKNVCLVNVLISFQSSTVVQRKGISRCVFPAVQIQVQVSRLRLFEIWQWALLSSSCQINNKSPNHATKLDKAAPPWSTPSKQSDWLLFVLFLCSDGRSSLVVIPQAPWVDKGETHF